MSNTGTDNREEQTPQPGRPKVTFKLVMQEIFYWLGTALSWLVWLVKVLWVFMRRQMRKVGQLQPTVRALCIALACVILAGSILSIKPAYTLLTAKPVSLQDDAQSIRVKTHAQSVSELLSEYNIVLGEGDVIYPEPSDPVRRGAEVVIRRAVSVSITADGRQHEVSLLNGTVGKALYLAGVEVDADDIVTPDVTETITDGMEITVNRVVITSEVEKRRLYYHTTYQDDEDLYIGTEEKIKRGTEGVKEVTLRVVTVDGQETERTVVGEEVLEPAVNEIIAKGTKPTPTPKPKPTPTPKKTASPTKKPTATKTSKPKNTPDPDKKQASEVTGNTITVDGKTYTFSKTMSVMITAYTHTGRKTSTGVWPDIGTVAVDPKVIPYGTKMYIPGYGFGVAQDTGVKGEHIDVFFDTENECIQFGRKRDRTIYILSD